MADETITISKKLYAELIKARDELNALYAAGVDNWEGFSQAFDDDEEEEEDED